MNDYPQFHRYPEYFWLGTHLSAMDDLANLVGSLTSRAYLSEILVEKHHLSPRSAKERATRIVPHIRTALGFLDQSYRTSLISGVIFPCRSLIEM